MRRRSHPARRAWPRALVTLLLAGAMGLACDTTSGRSENVVAHPKQHAALNREPLSELPPPVAVSAPLAGLGRRLFEEKRLSSDGTVACSTCHDLARGGVDGLPRSRGVRGQVGAVNAPTVYNAALNFALFWDGRARTLEEQAGGPLTNPVEMGSSWAEIVAKLRADPTYVSAFAGLFADGV